MAPSPVRRFQTAMTRCHGRGMWAPAMGFTVTNTAIGSSHGNVIDGTNVAVRDSQIVPLGGSDDSDIGIFTIDASPVPSSSS